MEHSELFEDDIVVLDLVALLRASVVSARFRSLELRLDLTALVRAVYLRAADVWLGWEGLVIFVGTTNDSLG